MIMNKIMSIKTKLILLTIIIIIMVITYFYFILRDTSKDVSMEVPYDKVMNKNFTSLQSSILIENSTLHFVKEYPKELNDFENIDTSRVSHIIVPESSIFKFHKALQIKNAVSGITRSYLLGEVNLAESNKSYVIIYSWGILNENHFQEQDDFWDYKKAPWQIKKFNKRYANK